MKLPKKTFVSSNNVEGNSDFSILLAYQLHIMSITCDYMEKPGRDVQAHCPDCFQTQGTSGNIHCWPSHQMWEILVFEATTEDYLFWSLLLSYSKPLLDYCYVQAATQDHHLKLMRLHNVRVTRLKNKSSKDFKWSYYG